MIKHFRIPGLLIIALSMHYSCSNDQFQVESLTKEEHFPLSTTYNVEMIYSDSGYIRAIIKAPLRETYLRDSQYVEFKQGIDVQFFDRFQEPESKLTAKYAISYTERDIMEARNEVLLINEKGEQLNTEHLIWDQRANRIYSDVFVKITTPEQIIFGDGFESNQDFSKYKILKVKGIIDVKDE